MKRLSWYHRVQCRDHLRKQQSSIQAMQIWKGDRMLDWIVRSSKSEVLAVQTGCQGILRWLIFRELTASSTNSQSSTISGNQIWIQASPIIWWRVSPSNKLAGYLVRRDQWLWMQPHSFTITILHTKPRDWFLSRNNVSQIGSVRSGRQLICLYKLQGSGSRQWLHLLSHENPDTYRPLPVIPHDLFETGVSESLTSTQRGTSMNEAAWKWFPDRSITSSMQAMIYKWPKRLHSSNTGEVRSVKIKSACFAEVSNHADQKKSRQLTVWQFSKLEAVMVGHLRWIQPITMKRSTNVPEVHHDDWKQQKSSHESASNWKISLDGILSTRVGCQKSTVPTKADWT